MVYALGRNLSIKVIYHNLLDLALLSLEGDRRQHTSSFCQTLDQRLCRLRPFTAADAGFSTWELTTRQQAVPAVLVQMAHIDGQVHVFWLEEALLDRTQPFKTQSHAVDPIGNDLRGAVSKNLPRKSILLYAHFDILADFGSIFLFQRWFPPH